ncbi:hypothetical protein QJQ45_015267 [Haematococcus lacustris]|nr:hypothetical protein QJQ45_015267 [Haematococcus lacustris]
MCASHLLALNTTALLNTSRTAQELMPALSYFVTDVAQLMRAYLQDASITVNVPDVCAGNRTFAAFGPLINGTWPTLHVIINLLTSDPESRGALTTRDSLGFFTLYGMPFHRCQSPPTLACDNPIPVILPLSGERIEVSASLPVAGVNAAGDQAVLYGPIPGDGRTIILTTCDPEMNDWDSVLHLYQAASPSDLISCGGDELPVGVSAQPTDPPAPSPPVLASRPPAPPMYTPSPQLSIATGTSLNITFYGLDLWSLMTSWGSGIQALLEAQQPPSLSLQDLSAPGTCASQLLALNTTALLNTSRTAQELMPALSFFVTDVSGLYTEGHAPRPTALAHMHRASSRGL